MKKKQSSGTRLVRLRSACTVEKECHESEGTHGSERAFDVCRAPNLRWKERIGTRCESVTKCRSEGGVGKRKNTKQTLAEAETTNPGRDLCVMNLPSPEG